MENYKITENILLEREINILKKEEIKKLNSLGEGAHGKIYVGDYLTINKKVQLNKINLRDYSIEEIITQINNMKFISECINIPKFFGIWNIKENSFTLVSEFIDGFYLNECYEKMDKISRIEVIISICNILEDCHSKFLKVVEIRPQNIIIDYNYNVWLIDVGIKNFTFKNRGNAYNTRYLAPELFIINEEEDLANSDKTSNYTKGDIWSLGCTISEIFSGVKPWNEIKKKFNQPHYIKCMMTRRPFKIPNNIDIELREILEKVFDYNPDSRLSAKYLKVMLENYLSTLI
jgi:serine/threonine protein kinase